MASVSRVRRLQKGGFRACRPGVQTARRGIGIGAECRRGIPGFRAVPGVPSERMASVSAAKVPQSRRAGTHRAAGGFATDLPQRAGAGRGFRGGGRAYRRQKSVPGRAPRWRLTSEPGYHPHRLRYGTEIPLTRDLLRGAGSPTLPDQHHPPRKSVLLGEAFGFASTGPENLRPSTRHRDLHRPIHTDISTTIKQHNILGKHDPK